jgi:probable rRNA maturation factor
MITIDPPSSFATALSPSGLMRFLTHARAAVGVRGAVDVLLSDDSTLRDLNKNFRGKDKPTDVLSFPAPAKFAIKHAGDLAISLDTAAHQASTYGHTLRDEVKILLLHGLLHLSGEDHETDNGEMAAREAILRLELRLPATLIERTTKSPSKSPRITRKKPSAASKKPPQKAPKSPTRPKKISLQKKSASSRPKATPSAAAVKRPPHSARATAVSSSKIKRGGK